MGLHKFPRALLLELHCGLQGQEFESVIVADRLYLPQFLSRRAKIKAREVAYLILTKGISQLSLDRVMLF